MIFCGLGINNTMMYNQVKKTWAKQSVALDVSIDRLRPKWSKVVHYKGLRVQFGTEPCTLLPSLTRRLVVVVFLNMPFVH